MNALFSYMWATGPSEGRLSAFIRKSLAKTQHVCQLLIQTVLKSLSHIFQLKCYDDGPFQSDRRAYLIDKSTSFRSQSLHSEGLHTHYLQDTIMCGNVPCYTHYHYLCLTECITVADNRQAAAQ